MDSLTSKLEYCFENMSLDDDCIEKGFLTDSDYIIESDSESEKEFDVKTYPEESHTTGFKPDVDPEYTYSVMSIDIGVLHLGVSVTTLDKNYKIIEVVWVDLIDITKFEHKWGLNKDKCKLYHTKTFCDWLNHIFQENMKFFETVDYILIERQPPSGFVVVEQLIFSRWRDKSILISPNSMHSFFNMGDADYEQRKQITENIAKEILEGSHLLEQMYYYDRCHDIADSLCIMLYWVHKKQQELEERRKNIEKEKRMKIIMKRRMMINLKIGKEISMGVWFESCRYVK